MFVHGFGPPRIRFAVVTAAAAAWVRVPQNCIPSPGFRFSPGAVHSPPTITTSAVAALVNDSSLPASSVKVTRTLMVLPSSDSWTV